jgi:hypothetical protein
VSPLRVPPMTKIDSLAEIETSLKLLIFRAEATPGIEPGYTVLQANQMGSDEPNDGLTTRAHVKL